MARDQEHAALLDALSARLQRHLPELWQRLFDSSLPVVAFEASQRTMLCVQSLVPLSDRDRDAVRAEVAWLAATHEARIEPASAGIMLLSCEHATTAMAIGLELQRAASDMQLSVGLARGSCIAAVFEVDERRFEVSLGSIPERAERAAQLAAAGTILVSGEAYRPVRDALRRGRLDCLVTEEYDGYRLSHASIAFPPPGMLVSVYV